VEKRVDQGGVGRMKVEGGKEGRKEAEREERHRREWR